MAFYDDIDTTQKYRVLKTVPDVANRQFRYLKGVASTVAGSAVTYDEAGLTALIDTDTAATIIGPVAVAMAATVASTWGWYCVYGSCTVQAGDVADNGVPYATSTAGRLDDAAASIGRIWGAVFRSVDTSGSTSATIQLSYPSIGPDLSA